MYKTIFDKFERKLIDLQPDAFILQEKGISCDQGQTGQNDQVTGPPNEIMTDPGVFIKQNVLQTGKGKYTNELLYRALLG